MVAAHSSWLINTLRHQNYLGPLVFHVFVHIKSKWDKVRVKMSSIKNAITRLCIQLIIIKWETLLHLVGIGKASTSVVLDMWLFED